MSNAFRPQHLSDIVGIKSIKQQLAYELLGAKQRGVRSSHYLIMGPPGVGKTMIADVISKMTNGQSHRKIGAELRRPNDVHKLACDVKDGDVVFVEEAHSMTNQAIIQLLPWLDEGKIFGSANHPTNVAPKVSFIFPTTNAGLIHKALVNRCIKIHINPYADNEIKEIIRQAAEKQGTPKTDIHEDALDMLARSSRGIPRTALDQRLEPLLNIMAHDNLPLNKDAVGILFRVKHISPDGLEDQDITYCRQLAQLMEGNGQRPVSHSQMCQMLQFEPDVVSNVIESFLIKEGYVSVVSRGRILTPKGWSVFGKNKATPTPTPNPQPTLFSNQKTEGILQMMIENAENSNSIVEPAKTAAKPQVDLDFAAVEASIKAGTFKVNKEAARLNVPQKVLRDALTGYFGNRITFVRGKKGGPRLS